MLILKSLNPDDTLRFGQRLAALLAQGDVIALTGDLGAGKTLLVQGIASGLGMEIADVTSPTFTILNVYSAKLPIYHFDLYRLDQAASLEDVGFAEYVYGDGVALIEWAEKFFYALPDDRLEIKIERGQQPTERLLTIIPSGGRYLRLCEELKHVANIGY